MYTRAITVTDSVQTPIRATSECKTIAIQVDKSVANWPGADFIIFKGGSAQGIRFAGGTQYIFSDTGASGFSSQGPYAPNQIAGYVQLAPGGGSTTFSQDES